MRIIFKKKIETAPKNQPNIPNSLMVTVGKRKWKAKGCTQKDGRKRKKIESKLNIQIASVKMVNNHLKYCQFFKCNTSYWNGH